MRVTIDLRHLPEEHYKVNVDLQWTVCVTREKPGCLAGLFRKHNRVAKALKLAVQDVVVPEELVCDGDLFSILYDSQEYGMYNPVPVQLSAMTLPFQLLFHQGAIRDCRREQDSEPREYSIPFTVLLLDGRNEVVDYIEDTIDLTFVPLDVKPQYEIVLAKNPVQYSSSLGREKVGTLGLWLDEAFLFTPHQVAQVEIRLYKSGVDISQYISFTDGTRQMETDILRDKSNAIAEQIYIDFTAITNPVTDSEDYLLEATIVRAPYYAPDITERLVCQAPLTLLKDQQGTELRVFAKTGDGEATLLSSGHQTIDITHAFPPCSQMSPVATVTMQNIATDRSCSKAGLYLRHLTVRETIAENVTLQDNRGKVVKRFVSLKGSKVTKMQQDTYFLRNGNNAKTDITVTFNCDTIDKVYGSSDYSFVVTSVLEYEYYEDSAGTGVEGVAWQRGAVTIVWHLSLLPNPEWLCVDYGSSAIVCMYHKTILDLHAVKDRLFRQAGSFRGDTLEWNTPFLPSDLLLHPIDAKVRGQRSTLCSQQDGSSGSYLDISLCLSPTSSLIEAEVLTLLPCLKILVGNEYLPGKPDYMDFIYSRRTDKGTLESVMAGDAKEMDRDSSTSLLRIPVIFREAYATLFKYFLVPTTQGKSIDKLIITYPNTFTPMHLSVLRDIVQDRFPTVREGYLRFVSESDAVAAYYLSHWSQYNPGRDIEADETVVVYDMGAGTLDLTLLTRHYENGRHCVDLLGKLGTGKAGNYLDFLLGEILDTMVPGFTSTKNIMTTAPLQGDKERNALKTLLRDTVKPQLSKGGTVEIKLPNGTTAQVNVDTILHHPRFMAYIHQVTDTLLSQLLAFSDSAMTIDTILLSGRSSRLTALRQSIARSYPGAKIVAIDDAKDAAKTVVVEGAMQRVALYSDDNSEVLFREKRLYAAYGVAYKTLGGQYSYAELLSPATLTYITDFSQMDGYNTASKRIDRIHDTTLRLIQTYLPTDATIRALNNNDMEFITVMEEHSMANFRSAQSLTVSLHIDYNNNISLYADGTLSRGAAPRGVDLNNDITKRSIWPATI